MSNGASLGSDNNNNIMLTRNNTVIEFDRRLKMKKVLHVMANWESFEASTTQSNASHE